MEDVFERIDEQDLNINQFFLGNKTNILYHIGNKKEGCVNLLPALLIKNNDFVYFYLWENVRKCLN